MKRLNKQKPARKRTKPLVSVEWLRTRLATYLNCPHCGALMFIHASGLVCDKHDGRMLHPSGLGAPAVVTIGVLATLFRERSMYVPSRGSMARLQRAFNAEYEADLATITAGIAAVETKNEETKRGTESKTEPVIIPYPVRGAEGSGATADATTGGSAKRKRKRPSSVDKV